MKPIISFLKNVLLIFELGIVIALVHWEKVLFVGIIALDQLSKMKVVSTISRGEIIPIIPDIFQLTYILNPGAAFGILPNQRIFFIAAGIVLLVLAAFFYPKLKKSDKMLKFGTISLVGGATANLIDRAQSGYVIDFIYFRNWPVFNFADVAIVIGMFTLIYAILFKIETTDDSIEGLR